MVNRIRGFGFEWLEQYLGWRLKAFLLFLPNSSLKSCNVLEKKFSLKEKFCSTCHFWADFFRIAAGKKIQFQTARNFIFGLYKIGGSNIILTSNSIYNNRAPPKLISFAARSIHQCLAVNIYREKHLETDLWLSILKGWQPTICSSCSI